MAKTTVVTDGAFDWADGVNSQAVTTLQSELVPHGVKRSQLAWLNNATVRGGGILQRNGWKKLLDVLTTGLYQGGFVYDPIGQDSNPYLIVSVSGRIYKVLLDAPYTITDLSAQFGLTNPAGELQSFFVEGNGFLVIQAGDGVTLPLFYASAFGDMPEFMRRSNGLGTAMGVTAANFVVPNVGAFVDVTLTSPYLGTENQIVFLNSFKYMQVVPHNFFTIQNTDATAGGAVTAGTAVIRKSTGHQIATVLVDFTIPAVGGSVNVFFSPDPTKTFTPPFNITINGETYSVTSWSHAAPGANHVFLVNLTDTPGATETAPVTLYALSELPAATAMVYYQGRIWYAQGRVYTAGDIEGNQSSGSPAYNFMDSVLSVTENPLAVGGDGFTVPSQAGNIRAFAYTANIDTTLGQGPLYIFTHKQVYSLQVPVTRADWIAATSNNQPVQKVAQISNGAIGDRSVVHVNGDLFYQSFDPAIRSLIVATRFYNQWGNIPISNNVNRALQFNDRSILRFAAGIEFDNRLLMGVLPVQTDRGVACQGMVPLDFDLVSTLQDQAPPAWEGIWQGVKFLDLFKGDFGGLPRAFALAVSDTDQSIDLWEITDTDRFDNAGTEATSSNRVTWFFETPAFTWGKEFELKQLHGGELWIDKVFGTVILKVEYRPDADPCWRFWDEKTFCVAKSCAEDVNTPDCAPYPGQQYREGYKWPVVLPKPSSVCDSMGVRPTDIGFQFQLRVTITGWCRVRGVLLYAEEKERDLYGGLTC